MDTATKLRFAFLIVAGAVIYGGLREYSLSSAAKAEPQTMTCARLAEMGPGENAHIELTDFLLCEQAYVAKEENGKWVSAWVPAVPRGGAYHEQVVELIDSGASDSEIPPPSDLRIIVKLGSAKNEWDVSKANMQPKLSGMVVNRIESLNDEAKAILLESYPGVDLDRCWIFHEGRTPTSGMTVLAMFAGALVVIVICLWPWLARLWRDETQQHAVIQPVTRARFENPRPARRRAPPAVPPVSLRTGDEDGDWGR